MDGHRARCLLMVKLTRKVMLLDFVVLFVYLLLLCPVL